MTYKNAKLVELINRILRDDSLIDNHELSVNLSTEDKVIAYWARRPSRRKMERYKAIVREARELIAKQKQ
jgi:hypothetical protein